MTTRALATAALAACLLSPVAYADDALVDGLREFHRWGAAGGRIDELAAAWNDRDDWIRQAAILVELGELSDPRAVPGLVRGLEARDARVVDFALHGLARLHADRLKQGGGEALPDALLDLVESDRPYHAKLARRLLTGLAGEDLGARQRDWKRWLRKHKDELEAAAAVAPTPPFDPAAHDAAAVAAAQAELDAALQDAPLTTLVRPRIPDLSSRFLGLRKHGLDLVICLDETGSMSQVIGQAKEQVHVLIGVLELLTENRRLGLLTYDDGVKRNLALTDDMDELRRWLPLGVVGGGDLPEGVDKALDVAFASGFGWRKRSVKAVVVIGDAPPHAPDLAGCLERTAAAHADDAIVVHTLSTGQKVVPELAQIAEAGGGQSLLLGPVERLIVELLLLSLGEELRPVTERLVPVAIEILAESEAEPRRGRRR